MKEPGHVIHDDSTSNDDSVPNADRPGRGADSVEAALSQVGDRWTFLLLREAFFGVRRFMDFQRNLGVARNLLSDRLGQLVANGIMERRLYQSRPQRYDYRLTDKGRDLYGVTVALMRWGDRWLTDTPPLRLTHAADGGEIEQELRCTVCGLALGPRDVHYERTAADVEQVSRRALPKPHEPQTTGAILPA